MANFITAFELKLMTKLNDENFCLRVLCSHWNLSLLKCIKTFAWQRKPLGNSVIKTQTIWKLLRKLVPHEEYLKGKPSLEIEFQGNFILFLKKAFSIFSILFHNFLTKQQKLPNSKAYLLCESRQHVTAFNRIIFRSEAPQWFAMSFSKHYILFRVFRAYVLCLMRGGTRMIFAILNIAISS